MMTMKRSLPFVLILGMTAGSTAAYAQALDADVTTGSPTICAEGDPDCVPAQGATEDATMDDDFDTAADSDVAPAADLDDAVTAQEDGSLEPIDGGADVATDTEVSPGATTEDGLVLNGIHSLASTEDLVGANVYDAEENRVGTISAVLPAEGASGEDQVVIGLGGFLGFGVRPVAVEASALQVAVDADGDIERVVTTHTQAELDDMPEVEM